MARATGPPQSTSQKTSANVIMLTSSTTAARREELRRRSSVLPPPTSDPSTRPTRDEVREREQAEQDHRGLAAVLAAHPEAADAEREDDASSSAGSASTSQIHQSSAE